ncbi:MAG: hypothetical protein GDA56_20745 [Hormoscilla sp. GM7CHS1pb]|nr:hypothetical protein [Hormoscilla sp. GM7CHS1pb]
MTSVNSNLSGDRMLSGHGETNIFILTGNLLMPCLYVIAQDLGGEGIWVLPVLHSYSGHRTGVNSPCTASECLTGQEQFLRSENFSNAYGVGGFDLEVVSRQPSARICS